MGKWFSGDSPQDIMNDVVNPQVERNRADYSRYQDQLRQMMAQSGYDFFAPQKTTETSTTNYNRLTSPEITQQYQGLEGMLRGLYEQRLGMGGSLPPGYEQRAISAINEASAGAERAALNKAAAAGFGGAQTYGVQAPIQAARAAQIADLRAQKPLLERQMTNEDAAAAANLTERFGKAVRERGTQTTTGERISPADIKDYLAYLAMAYQPYDTPIVVPQGRQGAAGDLISAGGTAAGLIWG